MKKLIFLILTVATFIACDSKRVFEEYKSIWVAGWHKDSAVVFNVDLQDTLENYNFLLNIRNKGNYPNSNIWLFVDIKSPDGKLLTDTVEFVLAENSGKWRGSGIGDLFDNQFMYKQNIFFPVSGEYRIFIRQGMRAKTLKGIQDIGIRIEKRK